MSHHTDSSAPSGAPSTSSTATLLSRRSAMKALFAAASAAVLFGFPRSAHAARATQETLDALSSAEEQLDAAQGQLDTLASQFQDLSIQQDKTISQIEDVQDKIDAKQVEIDAKQAELEAKQKQLGERVAASYKDGPNSMLTLLLSSGTFEELISNAHYVDKINDSDKRAIEEVRRIQDELSAQKRELETQKGDLEKLKSQQSAQLKDMQAKQAEVKELMEGLSQDVKDLMAKRDAEYLAAVQEEERQRQAAAAANGGTTYIPGNGQSSVNLAGGQQRIVASCRSTPSPGMGLCAMWVSQVFNRAGFPYATGNANDMYNAWCTSSNKADLKVGMVIAVSTYPDNGLGRVYGHIGIYIGDNQVMENVGSIQTTNLDSWIAYYGRTVTPRWGWLCGWVLE